MSMISKGLGTLGSLFRSSAAPTSKHASTLATSALQPSTLAPSSAARTRISPLLNPKGNTSAFPSARPGAGYTGSPVPSLRPNSNGGIGTTILPSNRSTLAQLLRQRIQSLADPNATGITTSIPQGWTILNNKRIKPADASSFRSTKEQSDSGTFKLDMIRHGKTYCNAVGEQEHRNPGGKLDLVTFTENGETVTIDPNTNRGDLILRTPLNSEGVAQTQMAKSQFDSRKPRVLIMSDLPRVAETAARMTGATDAITGEAITNFTRGAESEIWKIGDEFVPVIKFESLREGARVVQPDNHRDLYTAISTIQTDHGINEASFFGHGNVLSMMAPEIEGRKRGNDSYTNPYEYFENCENNHVTLNTNGGTIQAETLLRSVRDAQVKSRVNEAFSKLSQFTRDTHDSYTLPPDSSASFSSIPVTNATEVMAF